MLREILGTKREEVAGYWRKLHSEELHDLYLLNVIRMITLRRMRPSEHMACTWQWRGAYRVLVGRSEGKRPLGRHGHRWKDNIKVKLK